MIKNQLKKFFANKNTQLTIAWIAHFILWFVYKTSTIVNKGNIEEIAKYNKNNKSIILFTWHGKIAASTMELNRVFREGIKNGKKLSVLTSGHRDGQIAANIARSFNFETIEGSTIDPRKGSSKNKKSLTSIREIIKLIPQNRVFVFAGDGPRGPAFQMNTKITNIAQKMGIPIVCVGVFYSKKIKLKTWDQFEIPLPFGEITFNYSKLHILDKNKDIKEINESLQKESNNLSS
ncbi:MAG TPA: DUF374 domain-containing protein [Rickettsiales bacterium]|nr:DUF374 domain-containing protein [Rickettsiales bacterium]